MIDYILIRKKTDLRCSARAVYSKSQLIICVLDLKEGLNKCKIEFVKRYKVWKLRDDVTAGIFKEQVQTRAALVVEKSASFEEV